MKVMIELCVGWKRGKKSLNPKMRKEKPTMLNCQWYFSFVSTERKCGTKSLDKQHFLNRLGKKSQKKETHCFSYAHSIDSPLLLFFLCFALHDEKKSKWTASAAFFSVCHRSSESIGEGFNFMLCTWNGTVWCGTVVNISGVCVTVPPVSLVGVCVRSFTF